MDAWALGQDIGPLNPGGYARARCFYFIVEPCLLFAEGGRQYTNYADIWTPIRTSN